MRTSGPAQRKRTISPAAIEAAEKSFQAMALDYEQMKRSPHFTHDERLDYFMARRDAYVRLKQLPALHAAGETAQAQAVVAEIGELVDKMKRMHRQKIGLHGKDPYDEFTSRLSRL